MNPSRRRFLQRATVLAPAVILTPGLLMKVKPLWVPPQEVWTPARGSLMAELDSGARVIDYVVTLSGSGMRVFKPGDVLRITEGKRTSNFVVSSADASIESQYTGVRQTLRGVIVEAPEVR